LTIHTARRFIQKDTQSTTMPRDLEAIAKEDNLQGMPPITKSPDTLDEEDRPPRGMTLIDMEDEEAMINALSQRNEKRDELHPYTQTLKESDIESCVKLEEATFPENERCTREKVSQKSSTRLFLLPNEHFTVASWWYFGLCMRCLLFPCFLPLCASE
jgi:hypothetical protein